MRCRHVRRRLVAFQDDELSPGEAERVREHLVRCDACRARNAALRAVTPRPRPPVRPWFDPDWSRLDATLDHLSATPPPPPSPWLHPALLAAAGLLVGVLLGWGVHTWALPDPPPATAAGHPAFATDVHTPAVPTDAIRPASWSPDTAEPR